MWTRKLLLPWIAMAALLAGCDRPAKPVDETSKVSQEERPASPEDRAIKLLAQTIQSDHLYPDIKDTRCLLYRIEDKKQDVYEIAIHENHVDGCGGDPQTAPIRDRFTVSNASGSLQIYDAVNGEYIAYPPKRL